MKNYFSLTTIFLLICCNLFSQTPNEELKNICSNGPDDEKIVKELISKGAGVNFKDPITGSTPLILASTNCFENIVRQLLINKAKVDEINSEGETALSSSCLSRCCLPENYHTDVKDEIKKKNEEVSIRIIGMLINSGANVNKPSMYGHSPLMIACREGKCSIADFLIKKGADVNYKRFEGINNWTAIRFASRNGYVECVKLLINAKAKIDVLDDSYRTPLVHAILSGNLEIVKLLLDAGASPNPNLDFFECPPPILVAASENFLEIVKELLKHDAKVNVHERIKDSSKTPLMYAIENHNIEMEKIFRKAGALENLVGLETELIKACETDDTSSAKKIVDRGVLPYTFYEYPTIYGVTFTPLSVAAKYNSVNVVNYLLSLNLPKSVLENSLPTARPEAKNIISKFIQKSEGKNK